MSHPIQSTPALSASIQSFVNKWQNSPQNEQQDTQSFWIDFLLMFLDGSQATKAISFEKQVRIGNGYKRIDGYIPSTKVLIEQKSGSISLDDTTLH